MSSFKDDMLSGLKACPKRIPCKYLYDERGSALFDQICALDEYYLTRTELKIMQQHAAEMGEQIGEGVMLVEYGSGSSVKTRILLDHLQSPVAYVPVDISREHLLAVAGAIQADYPEIEVLPVCADFTKEFALPRSQRPATHAAVYFPGSTIGNLQPYEAEKLLGRIAALCGKGGGLLIGIDLQKEQEILERAYDDRQGITAEFNLNLLHRLKRELDAEIDVKGFDHLARYNQQLARVEIYIRSLLDQSITIGDEEFEFAAGELIHTEYSHKYTVDRFAKLAASTGLSLRRSWQDEDGYFAVLHFAIVDEA